MQKARCCGRAELSSKTRSQCQWHRRDRPKQGASKAAEGEQYLLPPALWISASRLASSSFLLCKIWLTIALHREFAEFSDSGNMNVAKCVMMYKGKECRHTSVSPGAMFSAWRSEGKNCSKELNPRAVGTGTDWSKPETTNALNLLKKLSEGDLDLGPLNWRLNSWEG